MKIENKIDAVYIHGINRKEDTRETKLQNMKNSNKKAVSLFDRVSKCNKRQRYTDGSFKNGQSRETGRQATYADDKQNTNTTQYVFDTTIRKQTQLT